MTNREPEERLIDFAVLIISISNDLPETKAGQTLSGQIVKSGTSPALNYGGSEGSRIQKRFYSQNTGSTERIKGKICLS
jgi:four helix bundle protein